MEPWVVSNVVAISLVGAGIGLGALISRNALWRETASELWHRRPLAIAFIALYASVAILDSVAWRSSSSSDADLVSAHQARSVIDRAFANARERSYSAPLAESEFYDATPLRHPGVHPFGTDILGRDVLYLTLKGAR